MQILKIFFIFLVLFGGILFAKNPQQSLYGYFNKQITTETITFSSIDAICKKFLKNAIPFIETGKIQLVAANMKRNQWFVSYCQIHNGIEIYNSGIKLRIFKNGNLLNADVNYRLNLPDFKIDNQQIDTNKLKEAAINDLNLNVEQVKFKFDNFYIYPLDNKNNILKENAKYKLVKVVKFEQKPFIDYTYLIDIENYEVLKKTNNIFNTDYNVKANIVNPNPSEPLQENDYFPYITLKVNDNFYYADENGKVEINEAIDNDNTSVTFKTKPNIKTPLEFSFCFVEGFHHNIPIDDNDITENTVPVNIINSNINISDDSLLYRCASTHYYAFYNMNDRFKEIDVDFHYLDSNYCINFITIADTSSMSWYNDKFVNANSDGRNIVNFYNPMNAENHIGQMPSVLYHELGHSINGYIYLNFSPNNVFMNNRALNEGIADIHSAFMLNTPQVSKGRADVEQEGDRNLKNTFKLGIDEIGEEHYDGQIISGAMWDFGELTSTSLMGELMHYTRFSTPDGVNNTEAFTNWLIEMLITDDDDGTLENLTPHFYEIEEAFNNHNITFDLFFNTNSLHEPLSNTTDTTNPYRTNIAIKASAFFTLKKIEEYNVYLHYKTSNWMCDSAKIQWNEINGYNIGFADIPAQNKGTIVNYWFEWTSPFSDKHYRLISDTSRYAFMILPFDTLTIDSCNKILAGQYATSENEIEWNIDAPTFNIHNSYKGPKTDHTDTDDNLCWFISDFGQQNNKHFKSADLFIPITVKAGTTNIIELWYMNAGSSYSMNDPEFESNSASLNFYLSNDNGNTWTEIFYVFGTLHTSEYCKWKPAQILIDDYIKDYSNILLKIQAKKRFKFGKSALFIDDISVLTNNVLDVDDSLIVNNISLYPNPTNSLLNVEMNLPVVEDILIKIYDKQGKKMTEQKYFAEIGDFTASLDISNLISGHYTISIECGNRQHFKGLVVK